MTEYKKYTSMNIISRSVTYKPFVNEMPAFLQVLYTLIFDTVYSCYHVIFITDLWNLGGMQSEAKRGNTKYLKCEMFL